MAVVTINKNTWAELVSSTSDAYVAKTKASHGFDVFIGTALPAPEEEGVPIPGGPQYAATRLLGNGKVFGKVPSNAPYDTAPVVVLP